jgi:regulator of nucleoside diphosphate kinase
MRMSAYSRVRPPIHLLASESDLVAALALNAEHQQPVVAAMLLEEIERAELHGPGEMLDGYVRLNSSVTLMDEKTRRVREVQLVLPGYANIAEGRISILTPIGAALYGLAEGACITWPDLDGNERLIRVVRVGQRPHEDAECIREGAVLSHQSFGDRAQAGSDLIDERFVCPRGMDHIS